ncbi:hypothetical protein DPMN_074442 [Dreissena polymorpha]|uniref:Uncharacterized protein n=1 Tax=Dreissena polymorpha TaxID=45954 RepID=A0A9D3YG91_DREPO|nr:hypothetical protein DPMN_074442 [Dreissena polymorpha]
MLRVVGRCSLTALSYPYFQCVMCKKLFFIVEFREKLIGFYKTKITVSISPLFKGRDKPIWNIFVLPILAQVAIEKDGSRKKTGNAVHQYKDIFYNKDKLSRRVFVQGEPGMGKSTFLTKLALDGCESVSMHNPEQKKLHLVTSLH